MSSWLPSPLSADMKTEASKLEALREMSMEQGAGDAPASSLWRTPTPYILLMIGFLMLLIALVLLVLVCSRNSHRRSLRRGSSDSDDGELPRERVPVLAPLDREPKIAVIMAGERAPSFLASATPLACGSAAAVPYV